MQVFLKKRMYIVNVRSDSIINMLFMAKLCERTGGIYYERKYDTDLGIITVNPEVIAKYAGSVAVECFGIVGMAAVNMKDGTCASSEKR